jgi:hypothetical protein
MLLKTMVSNENVFEDHDSLTCLKNDLILNVKCMGKQLTVYLVRHK